MTNKSLTEKRIRKSYVEWTDESTIVLIENVKLNENIWNPTNLQYRDRKAHDNSWNNISNKVEVSKDDAVNKWNAMRGNYRVFRRNQINGYPVGKKRPNTYFCKMSFLDPVLNLSDNATSETSQPAYKSPTKLADNVSKQEPKEESPKKKRRCTVFPSSPTLKKICLYEETVKQDSPLNVEQKFQQQKQILPNRIHNKSISSVPSTSSAALTRHIVVGKDDDDEWSALGKLITTNARTWSKENMAFARSYKAELSAINAKFELQAAKMAYAIGNNSSVTDLVHSDVD